MTGAEHLNSFLPRKPQTKRRSCKSFAVMEKVILHFDVRQVIFMRLSELENLQVRLSFRPSLYVFPYLALNGKTIDKKRIGKYF